MVMYEQGICVSCEKPGAVYQCDLECKWIFCKLCFEKMTTKRAFPDDDYEDVSKRLLQKIKIHC